MTDLLTDRASRGTRGPGRAPGAVPMAPVAPVGPVGPSTSRESHLVRNGAISTVLLVIVATALVLGPTSADPDFIADVVSMVASYLGFLCCLHTARTSTGALRASWALFATTMGMWAAADTIWLAYATASGQHPLTSVADWLYLLGISPAAVGLMLFPAGTWERGARSRLVLDVLVLGSGLLLCSQLLVLDEVTKLNPSAWDRLIFEIYPVTDVLLAGLAVLLLIRTAGRPRLDLTLVALAFVTWTATDNGYALLSSRGDEYTGSLVAVGYVVAPLLLGLGALSSPGSARRKRTLERHPTGTASAMLPDLVMVVSFAVVVQRGLDSWPDWTLAGVTLAFTAVRQLVFSFDNHGTRMDLERKVDDRTLELRQLSERHSSILEAVGEGIVGVDEAGEIVFVNRVGAAMLGWAPRDLEGRNACRTLCLEQPHDQCVIDTVMALGQVVERAETRYVRRNGSGFPVEITAAPRPGTGGPAGAVLAFRDVSDRLAIDQMKRDFVSTVSHELRTPLTAIRGSLELLADGDTGELPAEAQGVVDMAMRGSERLTRLVNDILDVERLQAGSFDVRPKPQDVGPIITSTVASLQPLARAAGVTLTTDAESVRALCDADRLVQALTNLVANAIKFTPQGGLVQVSAEQHGRDVLVSVRDEGCGIPAEHLGSVFEPFHQVDFSDARDNSGTGLGLTITRSIIERLGGHIDVESVVGAGSTFRFSLPAAGD